jgi:hypothetical protein
MNTDVLGNIAGYCDIDTRRDAHNVFGPVTRPLKRNADFDAKLQAIHQMRHEMPIANQFYRGCWSMCLNNRMTAMFYDRDTVTGATCGTIHTCSGQSSNTGYSAVYEWMSYRSISDVDCTICNVRVNGRQIDVHAKWLNNKWTVYPCRDRIYCATVRLLGFFLGEY